MSAARYEVTTAPLGISGKFGGVARTPTAETLLVVNTGDEPTILAWSAAVTLQNQVGSFTRDDLLDKHRELASPTGLRMTGEQADAALRRLEAMGLVRGAS